jgi:hypothetical protein
VKLCPRADVLGAVGILVDTCLRGADVLGYRSWKSFLRLRISTLGIVRISLHARIRTVAVVRCGL